jgi:nucleoid-associated protein YgaU
VTSDAAASKPVEAEAKASDPPDPGTSDPGRTEKLDAVTGESEQPAASEPVLTPAVEKAAVEKAATPAAETTAAPAVEKPGADAPAAGSEPDDEVADEAVSAGPDTDAGAAAAAPRRNDFPVPRPPEMILGAMFLTFAALPLVLAGSALMLQLGAIGPNLARLVPERWPSVDVGSVVLLVRVAGALLFLLGAVFVALAWIAVKPRRWARKAATIVAGVEAVLLIGGMVATAADPVSVGLVVLAGAGAVLLYLPRSEEFLSSQR